MKQSILSRWQLGAMTLVLGFALASCSSSTTPSTSDVSGGVYTPTSSPFGSTYAQWSLKWWQWAITTPIHDASTSLITHPLRDNTGANAAVGQDANSSVFFLGGWLLGNGTYTRTVTIPASKGLFFPIINVEADTTGTPSWNADSVNAAIDGLSSAPITLSATLDGVAIPNLATYKVRTSAFSVTLPADNVYQFATPPQNYPAGTVINPIVGLGYYLMLAPLSKGTHILHFTGASTALGANQDITYNITSN